MIVICGKGGVGKTALTALLARALLETGVRPLLLVDADPAGGLMSAMGERAPKTLAGVREKVIGMARGADETQKEQLARDLDYLLLEALVERGGYSLLAMGRGTERGCFCPANALLRSAVDALSGAFAAVLIDAEAGLEQINRQVTRRATHTIVVTDGSRRSMDTLAAVMELVETELLFLIENKIHAKTPHDTEYKVNLIGSVPEDETLRAYDEQGRSLRELPDDSPALAAIRDIARGLNILKTDTAQSCKP